MTQISPLRTLHLALIALIPALGFWWLANRSYCLGRAEEYRFRTVTLSLPASCGDCQLPHVDPKPFKQMEHYYRVAAWCPPGGFLVDAFSDNEMPH